MEKKLTLSETILHQVDGKYAYVRVDGLRIEGSLEGKCALRVGDFGLQVLVPLQWNTTKLKNLLNESLRNIIKGEDGIGYKAFADVSKVIDAEIDKVYVQAANFYLTGIKNISTNMNEKGEITKLLITYEQSVISIIITN